MYIRGQHTHLGSVLVLGLGKSGKAVATYCADLLGSRVDNLFIAAGEPSDATQAFLDDLCARVGTSAHLSYAYGDDALDARGVSCGSDAREMHDLPFDLCIASPGIPFWHTLYRQAQSCSAELISEVEFAWRESNTTSRWVAITGTNGKTTTTACTAAVLRAAGFSAAAVGNIGDVCLEAVAQGGTDIYVAEVSSYQLYSTRYFAPDVAVVMNITPDHLHWHQSLEAYAQAKFKVLENLSDRDSQNSQGAQESQGAKDSQNNQEGQDNQKAQDGREGHDSQRVAILDATNDVVRAKVRAIKAIPQDKRGFAYIPVGTAEGIAGDMRRRCGADNAAFVDACGTLQIAYRGVEHTIMDAADLALPGAHNVSNALIAASVAVVLGADDAAIAHGLRTFAPLPHRIEPCGTVRGVRFFNDSKATNTDATCTALSAFPDTPLIVLLGGQDKGTDLEDLTAAVYAHAKAAVCFGAAGPRLYDALASASCVHESDLVLLSASTLEDAVDTAFRSASEGAIVLLSPACASFDEFVSYEQRGDEFKRMVHERAIKLGE